MNSSFALTAGAPGMPHSDPLLGIAVGHQPAPYKMLISPEQRHKAFQLIYSQLPAT
jgi:hypothetical protein